MVVGTIAEDATGTSSSGSNTWTAEDYKAVLAVSRSFLPLPLLLVPSQWAGKIGADIA